MECLGLYDCYGYISNLKNSSQSTGHLFEIKIKICFINRLNVHAYHNNILYLKSYVGYMISNWPKPKITMLAT